MEAKVFLFALLGGAGLPGVLCSSPAGGFWAGLFGLCFGLFRGWPPLMSPDVGGLGGLDGFEQGSWLLQFTARRDCDFTKS